MNDRQLHDDHHGPLIGTYQMPPILSWSWSDDIQNIKRLVVVW